LTSDTKQEEFDYEIFVFTILLIFILYYELGIMKHGKWYATARRNNSETLGTHSQ